MDREGGWDGGMVGGGAGGALSSAQPPPSAHRHSSAFLMRPEGAVERAAEGAPGRPRPVIDKPWAPGPLGPACLEMANSS